MKYDVFISCRSHDYAMAEEISTFLKEKGLKVFFSNRSIDHEGRSLYEKVIANAIRDSSNMIVVCSNANYVKFDGDLEGNDQGSRWVYYEWSTFHRMILDKEKPLGADIVTIYSPEVNLKDLPHRLRNRQCIPYSEYKNRILRYVDDNIRERTDGVGAQSDDDVTDGEIEENAGAVTWLASLRRLWLPLLAGIVGLLLAAILYSTCRQVFSSDKMLVLAGGGSVVTFLDDKYRGVFNKDSAVNVFGDNKYPNAFYLHMPSRVALTLLAEEAIMPYSSANQPFYPVCLSAEKADTSMFIKNCTKDQILETGHIVEYHLGDEQLAVYVHHAVPRLYAIIDSSATVITVDQLIELLHLGGCNFFSTSEESGTYNAYYNVLKNGGFDLSSITDLKNFTNQSDREHLQVPTRGSRSLPFVIMGGRYYRPQLSGFDIWLSDGTVRQLMLVNGQGPVTRPLYLYFLAYRQKIDGEDQFIIPDEVMELLYSLDYKKTADGLIDDNNRLIIKNDTQQLIIPIN